MAVASIAVRSAVGAALSAVIAARAVRRRSLDVSGGVAGFAVMAIHLACGYRYGALLLAFFFTSSKVTKIGEDRKRRVEEDFKEGGQRNWMQVLANSAIATVLVIILAITTGGQDQCLDSNDSKFITGIIGSIIGHYCCCNGDTWSSEIGVLSDEQPRLITTLKPVRKGTNGGVTLQGLLAATAGGLTIGLTFVAVGLMTAECSFKTGLRQLLAIPISAAAGLLGSLIDSLLGATLQFSGYCSVRKKIECSSPVTWRHTASNPLGGCTLDFMMFCVMELSTPPRIHCSFRSNHCVEAIISSVNASMTLGSY